MDHRILTSLQKAFTQDDVEQDIVQPAEEVFSKLQNDMRTRSIVHVSITPYSQFRSEHIYIIADVAAGLRIGQYDWYTVSSIL